MRVIRNVLYSSSLCSERLISYLLETSSFKPLLSIQKFHRLFAEGLSLNNIGVCTLSVIPTTYQSNPKLFWHISPEINKGVYYRYLPFINIPFLRHFIIFITGFFQAVLWCMQNKKECSIIVVDVLNVSVSLACLLAGKICGNRVCAIVTDVPSMLRQIRHSTNNSLLAKLSTILSTWFISTYDVYILLTSQMNELVNPRKKPCLIMEGLVDNSMSLVNNELEKKDDKKIILYAGGLYEKYGIKKLLDAFILLKDNDIRLHIYGSGNMDEELKHYCHLDKRISYFSVVPNDTIVKKQLEATLLINPRPSNEEFTKYSFPSKNLEYMVSGTPVLTTPLPGMPKEYYKYVLIIEDESIEGIALAINKALSMSQSELYNFGNKAKQFVLGNKGNIIQAKKFVQIIDLL